MGGNIAVALGGVGGTVGLIVLGLYSLARLGRRWRRAELLEDLPEVNQVSEQRTLPRAGYLTPEEELANQWPGQLPGQKITTREANHRDLVRIAAAEATLFAELNRTVEQFFRDLGLTEADRTFLAAHTGELQLDSVELHSVELVAA